MKAFTYMVLLFCLYFPTAPVCAADDYWPLEVGNRWVYERRHSLLYVYEEEVVELKKEEVVLEVLSQEEVNGQVYSRLSNGQLLRKDEEGNIIEHNNRFSFPDTTIKEFMIFDVTNLDDPEYRFYFPYGVFTPEAERNAPVGHYPVYRRATTVTVPAGVFDGIHFGDGDLTGGITIFLGLNVGVVMSVLYTNADTDPVGVDLYELVRYRVDGKSYPTAAIRNTWGEIKRSFLVP